jgi:hypothetical protein
VQTSQDATELAEFQILMRISPVTKRLWKAMWNINNNNAASQDRTTIVVTEYLKSSGHYL